MARLARLVVPHMPHHVTQRGNRRQQTFFADDDYRAYLDLLTRWSERAETQVWAYCLMSNHVHVIAVPADQTGLTRTFAETHRRYTRLINQREGWRGHLWQSDTSKNSDFGSLRHDLTVPARLTVVFPGVFALA